MPYEQKPNTGSLFLTPKKVTMSDGKEFDSYGGSFLMECPHCGKHSDHWLNGTKRETSAGEVMGLKLKIKQNVSKENSNSF